MPNLRHNGAENGDPESAHGCLFCSKRGGKLQWARLMHPSHMWPSCLSQLTQNKTPVPGSASVHHK